MCDVGIESANYRCKQSEAAVAPKLKEMEPMLSVQTFKQYFVLSLWAVSGPVELLLVNYEYI